MAPKTERFELRIDEEILSRVDAWRGLQSDVPSRAEAVRRLLETGLERTAHDSVRLSDGEKLILVTLADMFKHLKIKNPQTDIDFLEEIIYGGHYWALKWKLTGLFHGHEDRLENVDFVVDVLEMWDFIERGYSALSEDDKAEISRKTPHSSPKFFGFDGNGESELIGIGRFFVDQLDRFSRFKGREFNSHIPMKSEYAKMLRVFGPMRQHLVGRDLSAREIIAILQARHDSKKLTASE